MTVERWGDRERKAPVDEVFALFRRERMRMRARKMGWRSGAMDEGSGLQGIGRLRRRGWGWGLRGMG